MGKLLRVLVVEDSPDDAELLLHELRRGGYEPFSERVETAEDMEAALARKTWDIVLSDYLMPHFDGMNALKLLQAKGQDIPFIVVSGKIGEETAVAAMKAGAHDYVMKDNLKRLVPAIQRELQEAEVRRERRRADRALQESERRLREAQALGRIGNWEFDIETQKIEWSDEVYELYGRDKASGPPSLAEEALYYSREEAEKTRELARLASQTGQEFNYDLTANLPGGKTAFFSTTMRPIKDSRGRVVKLFGTVQDITKRKKTEEELKASEEKYRNLVENAPVSISLITLAGHVVERNRAAMELYGFESKEDLLKYTAQERYFDPKDRERFLELVRKGEARNFEVRMKKKDGSPFWASLSSIPQMTEYGPGIITIGQDINERKKAEEALGASEEKFRNLVENAPVGISITTSDGRRLEANKAAWKMHGYSSREEYLKISAQERYYDLDDRNRLLALLEKEVVRNFEVRLKREDGSLFWGLVTAMPQFTATGEKQFLVITQDITERKQGEENLRRAAQEWRTTFDSISDMVSIQDRDYKIIRVNKTFANVLKKEPRELIGKTCYEMVHGTSGFMPGCPHQKALETKKPVTVEIRNANNNTYYEIAISPIFNDNGEAIATVQIIKDITERKKTEEALRASEEKFRSLVENAPIGITVTTLGDRRLDANRATMEMHGYDSKEEYLETNVADCYADQDERKYFMELLEKGPVQNYELRRKRKDGSVFWASLSSIPFAGAPGETLNINVIQDIDEKKKAEEENRLKAMLLDSAGDMILLRDITGKILYINDAGCKAYGYTKEEAMKMNIRDLIAPEKVEGVSPRNEELLKKGEARFETTHVCKDGTKIPLEIYHRLIKLGDDFAIISVERDISERRKMEEQLIITDRLASIGELAAGVAHEVNNPLTSVIGFSELLLEQPLPENIKEDLTTILNEAQRAAGVVRNLLTFAHKHTAVKQPVNLNDIIKNALELRVYEENINNISVITRLAPDLEPVTADASQLQQVFFNIITNAEYFMIETHHGGTLTITTENIGGNIRASFADDGPGMTAENLSRLFTPFFTTKPVGRGTGLGLSICHGIITSHEGRMYAESVPGKGATFIVELPATRNQLNQKKEAENGEP